MYQRASHTALQHCLTAPHLFLAAPCSVAVPESLTPCVQCTNVPLTQRCSTASQPLTCFLQLRAVWLYLYLPSSCVQCTNVPLTQRCSTASQPLTFFCSSVQRGCPCIPDSLCSVYTRASHTSLQHCLATPHIFWHFHGQHRKRNRQVCAHTHAFLCLRVNMHNSLQHFVTDLSGLGGMSRPL